MARSQTITLEGIAKAMTKDGFTARFKKSVAGDYIEVDMEKIGCMAHVKPEAKNIRDMSITVTMNGRASLKEDRNQIEDMIKKQITTSINKAFSSMGGIVV